MPAARRNAAARTCRCPLRRGSRGPRSRPRAPSPATHRAHRARWFAPRTPAHGWRTSSNANAPATVRGQCGVEAVSRIDSQLAEDLVQVPLDRARTEEQLGADLRVGEPVAGEPGDLLLLRREVLDRTER